MDTSARIMVVGTEGVIGAALMRELRRLGYASVLGVGGEADNLCDARAVEDLFEREKPEFVFHAGGKTAGIVGNQKRPAELMLDNLLVTVNVLASAWRHRAKKLLYLLSSCSYPRQCPQPMKEESLLTGPLEPTNEPYAVAKLAGLELCQSFRRQHGAPFIVGIPPNVFGPGDDFSPEDSHVAGALMRRFHEAKRDRSESVTVWGSGAPRREFLYVDDLASACLFAMDHYDGEAPINLGGGADVSIAELAAMIREVVGFQGQLLFDRTKADGMPVKVLDSSRFLALGWKPRTPFRAALQATYKWYCEAVAGGR